MSARNIATTKTIRGSLPRVSFEKIGAHILGSTYELSVVLAADSLMHSLNRKYKKRDYPANTLAFPLSKTNGEIFINVRKAAREAKRLNMPVNERIRFLFIHSCLHLRGLSHGPRMEKQEAVLMKKFSNK